MIVFYFIFFKGKVYSSGLDNFEYINCLILFLKKDILYFYFLFNFIVLFLDLVDKNVGF